MSKIQELSRYEKFKIVMSIIEHKTNNKEIIERYPHHNITVELLDVWVLTFKRYGSLAFTVSKPIEILKQFLWIIGVGVFTYLIYKFPLKQPIMSVINPIGTGILMILFFDFLKKITDYLGYEEDKLLFILILNIVVLPFIFNLYQFTLVANSFLFGGFIFLFFCFYLLVIGRFCSYLYVIKPKNNIRLLIMIIWFINFFLMMTYTQNMTLKSMNIYTLLWFLMSFIFPAVVIVVTHIRYPASTAV